MFDKASTGAFDCASRSMATRGDLLITALFKPTSGGWVYRAPNPRIFGRPTHYLVSDGQRAEIIEALTLKRPMTLVLSLAALIGAWVVLFATAIWFGYRFEQPTALELLIMVMLILAPVFAVVAVIAATMRNRIPAILAGTPVTQETITYREMRAMAARLQPKRSLRYFVGMGSLSVLTGSAQVFQLIERHSRHPFWSDAFSHLAVLVLLLAIWLAIKHFVLALRSYRDAQLLG
jgi:hypothetical protein